MVLQEMSHGPITAPKSFFSSVEAALPADPGKRSGAHSVRHLGLPEGRPLTDKGWDYDERARALSEAYHKAAQENNALIADVGQRFYKWSDPQALYAADGIHPSELGSRIAAETIAAAIQAHKENEL